ncbi:MAG: hypothetical protein PHZ09_03350 [Eubacteriales bacterium]|nr:hypothetical protein [Eubacteriales bacterium]
MPYKQFDRSKLNILPLDMRRHDLDLSIYEPAVPSEEIKNKPQIAAVAAAMKGAAESSASSLMMCGGHVIRSGCGPDIIGMMRAGYVTHYATNGAGSIHDFELSLIGATCESVAKYISEGQFGLWRESGLINDILKQGVADRLGAGEAIGRYIWEQSLPYRERSILGMGYHLGVPCTVHIGIGSDIVHEHPNCDGAVLGEASYTDFLIYTETITRLENGAFLNFGSAVTGPEVYLKAIAMARNVARQEGRQIANFTTAVFDLLDLEGSDFTSTPPKSDPRYYFRPWKTILARTVADGGKSYYIRGEHKYTIAALRERLGL